MTTVYASIEAARVRIGDAPATCACERPMFLLDTKRITDDLYQMRWLCRCGQWEGDVLYRNIHISFPLWTEAQARAIIARRHKLNISLKDLSANVGVTVSHLADFERRHAAPMPEQHAAIMAELNLIWIAQVHYVDSSVFIGAFTSDVNARAACQQWRDERDDEPLQLAWSDGKTSGDMPMSNSVERDGVTAYVVHLVTIDAVDNSDGMGNRSHVEVR